MHRLATLRPLAAPLIAASAAAFAACSQKPVAPPTAVSASAAHSGHASSAHNDGEKLTSDQLKAIAAVRKATTQFHDLDAAIAAKYSVQYPAGCAESADGAQGFHYLNEGLVDDKVELLRP